MLKETETEKRIGFFDAFQFGGGQGPLGNAHDRDEDSITNAETFDIDYLIKHFNLRVLLNTKMLYDKSRKTQSCSFALCTNAKKKK